jgi:multidrug efflux pump subunit AcrA (membrane-fusion protein)
MHGVVAEAQGQEMTARRAPRVASAVAERPAQDHDEIVVGASACPYAAYGSALVVGERAQEAVEVGVREAHRVEADASLANPSRHGRSLMAMWKAVSCSFSSTRSLRSSQSGKN